MSNHVHVECSKPITLANIDELIYQWQKECDDLDPRNVDSMDRPAVESIDFNKAYHAICMLPQVLRQHKESLLRNLALEERGSERKWRKRLQFWK